MVKRTATAIVVLAAALGIVPSAAATSPGRDGLIAFQGQTDDGVQVFTMKPNGHDLRQITHIHGDVSGVDWSPDGRLITMTLDESDQTDSGCVVAVMHADGSRLRRIETDAAGLTPGVDVCQGDSSFLPDGRHLLVDRFDPALDDEAIYEVGIDGTGWRRLTNAGAPDPNASPDGRRISFKGAAGALFVQRIDGTGLRQVTPSIDIAYKSDWAPDGRHLVLSDYANPDPTQPVNVATVRPDGSEFRYVTRFTDPIFRAYVGSYSPDGRWIVFRLERAALNAVYRIHPDGSGLHRITEWSEFRPRGIDWGPAGS